MYALRTPSPDFFLAMSHKKRVYVNAVVNKRIASSVATELLIEAGEKVRRVAMKPQDMYIWPGMLLIGNPPRSTKGGIANGVLYTGEDERRVGLGPLPPRIPRGRAHLGRSSC